MFICEGFATPAADQPLAPFRFERRDVGERDVKIDILFCGVCHSDLHQARNDWRNTTYPCLPGHEIVGRVSAVGAGVTKFKVGDLAGVGCMVASCQACAACADGLENYCQNGFVATYNGVEPQTGRTTFGGYSEAVVVDEGFTLRIPENLELAAVAPLLCAGITTYSPLRHWDVGPGQKVGIVGLGGLGHMGVKLAHAMGAHVVLFTTSPGKADDARRLGADEVIVSTDPAQMGAHGESFDFILDCVAAEHDVNAYLNLLKRDGTMCQVGAPERPLSVAAFSVIWRRRNFAGSLIGGIAETQEMLDFCAEHGIVSDIEMIDIHDIEAAYARMLKSDVKYRFVIDMATLKDTRPTA
ncbi:NAD(P)-dependent alcohol dehydrogenase [Aureimonas flava]|uniref:NAD(P)-dependent alcohol dehydrogenase n=1 Tax=Aureimonas flava TaxID=2320271 RepID=A0A3A1WT53_9HYPH|nr:NAD(P)-dependent alcohol dehydrogenase [Aureimonas flava]RIY00915.1 NAD(P)-dependent alcohol dehydrogenase [Aureimonas flava]